MKTRILFLCIGNACRSQMAEGFAKKFGGRKVEVFSAGLHPAGFVSAVAMAMMKEVGIDISKQQSKGLDDLPEKEFDYVVTMGCNDQCPFYPAKERMDWDIADPIGKPLEDFRSIRDEIGRKVADLLSFALPPG